jgi:PAS domain S-box-containing protein
MAVTIPSSSSLLDDPKQALRAEQLRLIFDTQHFNLIATLAITIVVAITLASVAERWRVIAWCVFMLAGSTARMAILIGWRRDTQRLKRLENWRNYLVLSSLIGGVGWGIANLVLFPEQSAEHQMLLVFITAGISSAAAISLAPDPLIAWSFLLPCILPMEFQIFARSNDIGWYLGVLGLVYMGFLAAVIIRLRNYVEENVALRIAEREREQLQSAFSQALHSSQEKLQALFELSPLGCILARSNGELVEANQAFKRLLGYDIEDPEQSIQIPFSAPECLSQNRVRWMELIENGGTKAFETQFVRTDGQLIPVSLHCMVVDIGDGQHYIWSLIEDITERKRHEEELRALNTRLSLATQAGGIGVWELDLTTNSLAWDTQMYEMYGLRPSSEPLKSDIAASLIHPEDWVSVNASLQGAVDDPHVDRHALEFRVILGNDNERWVRTAGLIQRDENRIARGIIGVAWDITELKRIARMKSEFVSSVSHELRTPLTSIKGSLGLLAAGVMGEMSGSAKELIDIAYKNSERLSLLINDILDIEKIDSGKVRFDMQPHALRPLIEQAIEFNRGYAQHLKVNLIAHIDADNFIVVDVNRFMQVMANLISNAVKFSNPEDAVEVAAMNVGARVRIEVRDHGPGIPMEFRNRIYQRFSQADSSDTRICGGSGLGLAITKSLVEKMQGEIGFTDRIGGGTIFYIELPCAFREDAHADAMRVERGSRL